MPKENCAVPGCTNSWYTIHKWRQSWCEQHADEHGGSKCTCPKPFRFIPFPDPSEGPEKELELKAWISQVNRQDPSNPSKIWLPTKYSRVCSVHFKEGHPTQEYPYPTENLPSTSKKVLKGRRELRRTVGTDWSVKRRRLESVRAEFNDSASTLSSAGQDDFQTYDRQESRHFLDHSYSLSLCENEGEQQHQSADDEQSEEMDAETTDQQSPAVCSGCCKRDVKIKNLLQLVHKLQREVRGYRDRLDCRLKKPFGYEDLNDDIVGDYTGISSIAAFNAIYNCMLPRIDKVRLWRGSSTVCNILRKFKRSPKKFGPARKLHSKDQMLVVLMKVRMGLVNRDLGVRFGVTSATIARIWNTWLPFLASELPIINPPMEAVVQNLPPSFKNKKYSKVRHIIDCTEIFIETPKNLDLAAATWSDYKHHHTVKILVSINPSGYINFVSKAYPGRASDQFIVQNCGFLDIIERGDIVLADRGFSCLIDEMAIRGVELITPPGKRGSNQMTKSQVTKTKDIANRRIYVEQVIARMKKFKMIQSELVITHIPNVDFIVRICSFLSNLKGPIYTTPANTV